MKQHKYNAFSKPLGECQPRDYVFLGEFYGANSKEIKASLKHKAPKGYEIEVTVLQYHKPNKWH